MDATARTITINVTTANDAPVNTVPSSQSISEDNSLVFSTGNSNLISIADVDGGSSSVQVTLTATHGTLTLSGTSGLSFSFSDANGTGAGDGTADTTMTFRGTITNINAALGGLTYTPATNYNGSASVEIITNDLGNAGYGGPKTDTDSVSITVNAVNDAPVITVPGAQTVNEDGTLVLSPGNGNAVSIADADAGSSALEMTIGTNMYVTLNLNGISGLTFSEGDGTADAYMAFTGTLANINAALNGISFVPDPNWHGAYLIVNITIDDQGNTGGGSLTDSEYFYIVVNSVNDAPSGANNTVYTSQDTDYVFSTSDFGFSDSIDGDAFLAVKITTLPTTGTLYWNNGSSWVAVTANQFISASDISAGKLKYTPPASYTGSPTFTFKVQDDGGTDFGGIDLDPIANTMTISVT